MGLTIYYALHAKIQTPDQARNLIDQLRSGALELPFKEVGEVVELAGPECDFTGRDGDDPLGWLLAQARQIVLVGERYDLVQPERLVAFSTWPGEGCEHANFGLGFYPNTVERDGKKLATGLTGWSWKSFCKTQYASDPSLGGVENFLRCHLSVIHLLDHARVMGILEEVKDEGSYWDNRDIRSLAEEVVEWNEQIAGLVGKMKDSLGGDIEAAILKFQNFEHLEAKGRKDG
jgi:hypothetical protein